MNRTALLVVGIVALLAVGCGDGEKVSEGDSMASQFQGMKVGEGKPREGAPPKVGDKPAGDKSAGDKGVADAAAGGAAATGDKAGTPAGDASEDAATKTN